MDQIPHTIKTQKSYFGALHNVHHLMEGIPYESLIHSRKSESQQRHQTSKTC